MNKFHDMTKLDKEKRIEFIYGRKNKEKTLEARNIELQQRIFNIEWNIDAIIKILESGNTSKALKLLKKVRYND